jgi:hypothetical protein
MAAGDIANGLDAILCDTEKPETWDQGMDADVHVVHSHCPDKISMDKSKKVVIIQHGSPEHIFEISVQQGIQNIYAAGDSFALISFFLRRANAIVTFWPRHESIWKTMTDRPVYCIPMGIDRNFWAKVEGIPPLSGEPAIFTAENAHNVKWPLDLFFLWPLLTERFCNARLHSVNIPTDQHRWWWPLSYMNTARYTMFMSAMRLDAPNLKNYLSAAPFYYSPVHYGDHNRLSMESAACGCKIISFTGNEYAHYWVREGDHRTQLEDLTNILNGTTQAREPLQVPTTKEMSTKMKEIYEAIV